jgi:hypothetical protein
MITTNNIMNLSTKQKIILTKPLTRNQCLTSTSSSYDRTEMNPYIDHVNRPNDVTHVHVIGPYSGDVHCNTKD